MHDTELAGHLLEAQAQAGRAGRAGQAVLPKGGLRRHQTDGTWGRLTADRLTTLSKPMTSVDLRNCWAICAVLSGRFLEQELRAQL